jgi:hypothetical protein
MSKFNKYFTEEVLSPSTEPNTMSFWHGGRLDDAYSEAISHKKGRWEYGPGLYLTTHYGTAQRYSKGNRKLYLITIRKGNDADDVKIPVEEALDFVNTYVLRAMRKEVIWAINEHSATGSIDGDIFINIIVNRQAIKNTDTFKFRKFLVQQGIDYSIVDNAFGWGEVMVVLFNMRNVVGKKAVNPKDKIEVFDLPTKWN